MMNLVKLLSAALVCYGVVGEVNCQELRQPVNLNKGFASGCPGAVMSNGKPSRIYCQDVQYRYPWYRKCCKWVNNTCVAKPLPSPTPPPTPPPVQATPAPVDQATPAPVEAPTEAPAPEVDCRIFLKKRQCNVENNGCSWSNGVCRAANFTPEAGSCGAIKGRKKCKKNRQCVYRFRRCTEVDVSGCGQYLKFKHCRKQEACHWEKNTCEEGAAPTVKDCTLLKKRVKCAARADCTYANEKCTSKEP